MLGRRSPTTDDSPWIHGLGHGVPGGTRQDTLRERAERRSPRHCKQPDTSGAATASNDTFFLATDTYAYLQNLMFESSLPSNIWQSMMFLRTKRCLRSVSSVSALLFFTACAATSQKCLPACAATGQKCLEVEHGGPIRPAAVLVAPASRSIVQPSINKIVVQFSLTYPGWIALLKEGSQVVELGELLPGNADRDKAIVRAGLLGYSYSVPVTALPSHSQFSMFMRLKQDPCITQVVGSFSTR